MDHSHNGDVQFRILSQTRGRLRARILGTPRHRREAVERIAGSLANRSEITDFTVNPTTGSVTLRYDAEAQEAPDVQALLAESGVRPEQPLETALTILEPAGVSDTATAVLDTVTQLDARLSHLLHRRVDLKAALPFTLLGLAIWKTATQGFGWKQLTASQLLWYAYAMFLELDALPAIHATSGKSHSRE